MSSPEGPRPPSHTSRETMLPYARPMEREQTPLPPDAFEGFGTPPPVDPRELEVHTNNLQMRAARSRVELASAEFLKHLQTADTPKLHTKGKEKWTEAVNNFLTRCEEHNRDPGACLIRSGFYETSIEPVLQKLHELGMHDDIARLGFRVKIDESGTKMVRERVPDETVPISKRPKQKKGVGGLRAMTAAAFAAFFSPAMPHDNAAHTPLMQRAPISGSVIPEFEPIPGATESEVMQAMATTRLDRIPTPSDGTAGRAPASAPEAGTARYAPVETAAAPVVHEQNVSEAQSTDHNENFTGGPEEPVDEVIEDESTILNNAERARMEAKLAEIVQALEAQNEKTQ